MKKQIIVVGSCLFFVVMNPLLSAAVDLGGLLKTVQETAGGTTGGSTSGSSDLSQNEMVNGLKEALQVGTVNTVQALSKADGYYDNPKIKIPLPPSMQKFEKILRATGFGSQLDEFDLSMNRAAEKAAPEAQALFVDAIKEMTFSDAQNILNGGDNAATVYFQEKTTDKLQKLLEPIIQQSMEQVGVTQYYNSLTEQIQTIPFASDYVVDLDSYVTEKSIDGLFIQLAEEEAKIRNDPAARVTDLLQTVFK